MEVNQCRLRTSRANCSRKQAVSNCPLSVENRRVKHRNEGFITGRGQPFVNAREKSLHIRTNRRHFRDSLSFTPEESYLSELGEWVKG